MKAIHFAILIIGLSVLTCKKKEEPPAPAPAPVVVVDTPTACFNMSSIYLAPLAVVNFTNCSQNYERAEWNFGDGGASVLSEPTYRYILKGRYTIKLKTFKGVKSKDAAREVIVADVFGLKFETSYTSPESKLKQGDLIDVKLSWKKATDQNFSECGTSKAYYKPDETIALSDNAITDFSAKYIFKLNYEYYRGYKNSQSMFPDILLAKDSLITSEVEVAKLSGPQIQSASLSMMNATYTISFTYK